MSKALKIALIAGAALIALFLLAAVILVATVDPNQYKAEIARAVKENTGRELIFEGDIGFTFFPWFGLKVGSVALGNAEGFQPKEMIRISKAAAAIRILPLLSGEVAIGVIKLEGFTLNLAVTAAGLTNWNDFTKTDPAQPGAAGNLTAEPSESADSKLKALSVKGIKIANASLVYDDQKTGKKTSLTNLNLVVGEIGNKARFPFTLAFDLKLDEPKISTRPELAGSAEFDLEAGTFAVSELTLSALGTKTTGLFQGTSKDAALDFTGQLTVSAKSLRKLLTDMGMEAPVTADPNALGKLSADLSFSGTTDSVDVKKLNVQLDDTAISGSGSVKNFARPAITCILTVDAVDIDRYLAPATEIPADEPKTSQAQEAAPEGEPDPVFLRDFEILGKLTIGKLKVMDLRLADILCQVRAKDGALTIKPFSAKLYEGVLSAEALLNATSQTATWSFQGDLKSVQAGPLLKDLAGKDYVVGTTAVTSSVNGTGLSSDAIMQSLSGTASFAITDGAINGINISKLIQDTYNMIKRRPATKEAPQRTAFSALRGSALIKNGHITNNDLIMNSDILSATGKGWVDLPKYTVDYLATVTVVGALPGEADESPKELRQLPLPLYVRGSLNDPGIGIDAKAMSAALVQGAVQQGTQKLEDTLRKKLFGDDKKSDKNGKKKSGGLLDKFF